MACGTQEETTSVRHKWFGYAVPLLLALVAFGCNRNPEHRATVENLNSHPAIVERGGVVKSVTMREPRSGVYEFEAEILDRRGQVIGTVRGARVENFGTRIHRIRWQAPEQETGS